MPRSTKSLFAGLKRTPFPKHVDPMLCTLVDDAFDDPNWIFEPKLDGLRVICLFDGKRLTLLSRNDKPQGQSFPEIVDALQKNLSRPAILDGEIVALDEHGKVSFRALQQRFHIDDESTVRKRMKLHPASLYLFDAMYYDGYDLRDLPLKTRKQALQAAIAIWRAPLFFTPQTKGLGVQLFQQACREHEEGIVAKRLDSTYVATRGGAWLKIKCSGRQEFVIGGWTDPQGSRVGLGALLVGYYEKDGKTLRYAGKVGTGFNNEVLTDLRRRLDKLDAKQSPFAPIGKKPPRVAHLHWVKPKLVAEIAFAEWTRHDLLRQPRYEGLRDDKRATLVRKEVPK